MTGRSRISVVTVDRVLRLIQDRGPIMQFEISSLFRRGRRTNRSDKVSRAVSACLIKLHEEGKIVPTKVTTKRTYWNAL